jgi:hypothetical protein
VMRARQSVSARLFWLRNKWDKFSLSSSECGTDFLAEFTYFFLGGEWYKA